jgi:hypothetical protein
VGAVVTLIGEAAVETVLLSLDGRVALRGDEMCDDGCCCRMTG